MIPIDGAGLGPSGVSNPDIQQAILKTVRQRVLLTVSTQSTQHWEERNHYEIEYENTGGHERLGHRTRRRAAPAPFPLEFTMKILVAIEK